MKPKTVMFLALLAYMAIGAGNPTVTALTQWVNSGEWPPKICWINIGIGALIGAATQLLSFLNTDHAKFLNGQEPQKSP